MNTDRPLEQVTSIKVKLALLVGVSVLVAAFVIAVGRQAGVPIWVSLPVTVAAALGVTHWLARGLTAPLREMTQAAPRMASGDYSTRIDAGGADEVGVLARAFNAMARDLADVDRQRRQLVATVSHELRTPLAAQRAVLENLVDGVTPPDSATLLAALTQSERLSDLVSDLLDLSRIDAGQRPLRTTEFAVRDLLAQAVAEPQFGHRSGDIQVTVQPANLVVQADRARLLQVVVNLLDNAVRHSPADGSIRVHAIGEPTQWTLDVTDDGPGLTPEQADRGFRQFGTGADDAGGGSGLGLAIAGWVVDLHGGSIRALEPTLERPGATVRVTVPTEPHTLPEAPVPTISQTPDPTPTTPTAQPAAVATAPAGTAYRPVEVRPFMDSLFGRLWPERDSRPQPRLVGAALAVGVLAAIVLPYRGIGVELAIVLLSAGAVLMAASARRRSPSFLLYAALAALLGIVPVLRANPAWTFLAIVTGGALTASALIDAKRFSAMIGGVVAWVLAAVRGLPLLGRTISDTSKHRLLWPILRTAALSLVALLVFGSLFASADAIVGSWAGALLPDLAWSEFIMRSFVGFFVGGIVLAGAYLALNPPNADLLALPEGRPMKRAWEWQVPVALVAVTYVAFLAAQGAAFFGGHDYVQRTTGLTYADYVHQGFGQLTVATILTLEVIGVVWRVASTATAQDRLALRVAVVALCVLTLLVVASALHRMSLYQEALGYTTLRVFVDVFEGWLGLVVLFVLVAALRLDRSWVARAALLSGVLLVLGLVFSNPDGRVASANISRYERTGVIDVAYLSQLSDDAAPTIENSSLTDDQKRTIFAHYCSALPYQADDALGWNLGRHRADPIRAKCSNP